MAQTSAAAASLVGEIIAMLESRANAARLAWSNAISDAQWARRHGDASAMRRAADAQREARARWTEADAAHRAAAHRAVRAARDSS